MELRALAGGNARWRLEVADTFLARLRGLMGRRELAGHEGLYLPGTNSIHMFFMRFAIDCLFLGPAGTDGAQRVVAIREGLAPWRGIVWWVRGAHGAVELSAGSAAAAGVRKGDFVRLEPAA